MSTSCTLGNEAMVVLKTLISSLSSLLNSRDDGSSNNDSDVRTLVRAHELHAFACYKLNDHETSLHDWIAVKQLMR